MKFLKFLSFFPCTISICLGVCLGGSLFACDQEKQVKQIDGERKVVPADFCSEVMEGGIIFNSRPIHYDKKRNLCWVYLSGLTMINCDKVRDCLKEE